MKYNAAQSLNLSYVKLFIIIDALATLVLSRHHPKCTIIVQNAPKSSY
jgi:hypothetical protein